MSAIVFVIASISALDQIVNDVVLPDRPSSRHPRGEFLFNFLMDL
jgi:hypothetical protein